MNQNVRGGTRVFIIDKNHKVLLVKHKYEEFRECTYQDLDYVSLL